ncbi:MAG: HEPN domain-containing protein [Gaiellaceae bacterium]
MAQAREQLAAARATLLSGFGPATVSLAYYAMLYAARAALSEEDLYAKTHAGTWMLFHDTFVVKDRFDEELFGRARKTLPLRLGVDYEAMSVTPHDAEDVVQLAARFIESIDALYPD